LAVFNTTSFRVVVTLRGTKRATFQRTCDPSTVCAFDNIQIAKYSIVIKLDGKVIVRKKCWAKGMLFTLIESRRNNIFKLQRNKDTFIFHIKRGAPLGFELVSRQVVRVLKGFKRPIKVGWTLDQVGPVVLKNVVPDEHTDLDEEGILNFRREIEQKIFRLVYSTFGGTVVLVFDTTTKLEGQSELSLSSDREKDIEIREQDIEIIEDNVEVGETQERVDEIDNIEKRYRSLSWPWGTSVPDIPDNKSDEDSQSSPLVTRKLRSLTVDGSSLKNMFSWPAKSKSGPLNELHMDADDAKRERGSHLKIPSVFSKAGSRIRDSIGEVQSTIYSSPRSKFSYPVLKEWFILIETHRVQLLKEREAIRRLVLRLQDAFEEQQVQMRQRMISVHHDGLSSSGEELINDKPQEVESKDQEETRKHADDSLAWEIDKASAPFVVEENVDRSPKVDCAYNSCSTPEVIAEEKDWELLIMPYDDIDENALDIDDIEEYAEESGSPPVETKHKVSRLSKNKSALRNKVPDTRKFEYPFVEAVRRLSTVGLELHDLDPMKFLEYEVHYVQASVEAQVAISGEPYDLGSKQNCAPGWSFCYMDSTAKVYWVRDSDGAISLDPPTEDFWVLLANPFEPLNPFPYPLVG